MNSVPKIHAHLEPQNETLFGNRVFASIIKDLENPMTGILMRFEDTEKYREDDAKMEAGIGMMGQ